MAEELKTKYKFIEFRHVKLVGWRIVNKKSGSILGCISLYEPWGQHVAEFFEGCVFNNQCLKDIADFLEQLNKRM